MLLINLFKSGVLVREFRLDVPTITIGRDLRSSVVLEDLTRHISRRHATIERGSDGYSLSVHSRVNPVLVDGRVMHAGQSMRLADGARIRMPPFELMVQMRAELPQPAPAGSDTPVSTSPTPTAPAPRFLAWARAALAQDPKPASANAESGGCASALPREPVTSVFHSPESASIGAASAAAEAYLRGLGLPYVQVPPGEEVIFLEQAGLLTQSIVETLVALLRTRTRIRHELNVAPPCALADGANPLKSTANPAEALAWLFDASRLDSHALTPVEAVEQVASELEAHQSGLAAGLRAVVLGMMMRLDPTCFEKAATDGAVARKADPAASWAAFMEAYAQLEADTAHGFGGPVAADFRNAYYGSAKASNC